MGLLTCLDVKCFVIYSDSELAHQISLTVAHSIFIDNFHA